MEKKFFSAPQNTPEKSYGVIEHPKLGPKNLEAFMCGKETILRIPNFCSPTLARKLTKWSLENPNRKDYLNDIKTEQGIQKITYGVDGIGPGYNMTYGTPPGSPERMAYHAQVKDAMERVREICNGKTPVDKLLENLKQHWPDGAERAILDGQEAMMGVIRITRPNENILEKRPHVDRPPEALEITNELSANIYLDVPEEGGELMVWPVHTLQESTFDNPEDFIKWAEKTFKPLIIKPQVGELILINTGRPHAVKSFKTGNRVSMQVFIGKKEGTPLKLWN